MPKNKSNSCIFERLGNPLQTTKKLTIEENSINKIVVGMPLNLKGIDSTQTIIVRIFIDQFKSKTKHNIKINSKIRLQIQFNVNIKLIIRFNNRIEVNILI